MKRWLSIEWLYYLFGLGLYEEEIVQDRACQKHWINEYFSRYLGRPDRIFNRNRQNEMVS